MKMKKTWFSYVLWLIYAIMAGVFLAACLSALSIKVWKLNAYLTAAVICLGFAGFIGIWFAGRQVLSLFGKKVAGDSHLANMWECFLVMGLSSAAILYRFYLILHFNSVIENSMFYDMAAVKSTGVPPIAHGASYVYTQVLSFLLSFTGNKVVAGIMLQLFLEVAALLLFYWGVRLLAGRVTAVCAMAAMTFYPVFCGEMFRLTPEVLHFLLMAAGLLFLGFFVKAYGNNGEKNSKGSYIAAIPVGIYAGIMGYLDASGWVLLLFIVMICVKKAVQKEMPTGKAVMLLGVFLLYALAAMAGLVLADSMLSGRPAGSILSVWWSTYADNAGVFRFPINPAQEPVAGILIYGCSALGAIGFWFHKEQKQDGWILMLAVLTVFTAFGVGVMDYSILTAAVWSVLAGMGIASMRMDAGEARIGVVTYVNGNKDAGSASEEAKENDENDDIPVWERRRTGTEDMVVEEITEDTDVEEIKEIEEKADMEDAVSAADSAKAADDAKPGTANTSPQVQLIENPLPLPKKHVKKEMGYGREIEGDADFDVAVDDGDDFDI